MTHTYAVLELSRAAVEEIRRKFEEAGYQHAFLEDGVIDMHGIAVRAREDIDMHEIAVRAREDTAEELLAKRNQLRKRVAHLKHGPGGTGRDGPCDLDCLKCRLDKELDDVISRELSALTR